MAGDAKKLQPIIIKKVKKGGHAAHGGAWKIAYADFVTAMMAFFLLMWLLGSTTEGDKKGIAEFFQSPLRRTFPAQRPRTAPRPRLWLPAMAISSSPAPASMTLTARPTAVASRRANVLAPSSR